MESLRNAKCSTALEGNAMEETRIDMQRNCSAK
nr:MAG TPA: hypothetical protein [Caudoviricetes sp.]